jgi:exodeoxyribonuclease VII large subunit
MEAQELRFSVSDFVAVINQTLEYALPSAVVVGEVSGLRISQNKWVRFKLKDEQSSVDFFGSIYQMNVPLEDGMVVAVQGRPRLSDKWGFSVSFSSIQPVGEGSIKRSFELLLKKLEAEGLFAPERKRPLPELPAHIGVISSTQAAGYTDFITILNERFGGIRLTVCNTLVQGVNAPGQLTRALRHLNETADAPDVIVIVRGGGDPDDLAAFNDEGLVRAIAASRVPTLVGVGHEIDTTLADLAADVRAATPTNAAQILVPDRRELIAQVRSRVASIIPSMERAIERIDDEATGLLERAELRIDDALDDYGEELATLRRMVSQLDPMVVLKRGYALVRGSVAIGSTIEIERFKDTISAEVKHVSKR